MSVIYIFRRDFRLRDNLAIYKLLDFITESNITKIYFTFIFTPEQTDPVKNKYFTQSGFNFMMSALRELSNRVSLNFLYGDYTEQLNKILDYDPNINSIFFNHDYSAYAQKRDVKIFKLCQLRNISVYAYHDLMLKGKLLEKGYKVMNAYVKRIKNIKLLPVPKKINNLTKFAKKLPFSMSLNKVIKNHIKADVQFHSIVKNPSKLVLDSIRSGSHKKDGSRVGPYVKFGLISCRELYLLKTNSAYKREVIIREFFYQCQAFYKEDIEAIPHNWKSPYTKIEYNMLDSELRNSLRDKTDKQIIKSFYTQSGPFLKLPSLIQDFITRLIENNYLHNRERMMLATFLLHNMDLNWKLCERFYAQNLQDYDPIINGLNWMWVLKVFFHTRPQIMKLKNFHY